MKVTSTGPTPRMVDSGINATYQQERKAAAIAKLSGTPAPQVQETLVQNPSRVSVEELGAIKPSQAVAQAAEQVEQAQAAVEETVQEIQQVKDQKNAQDPLSSQYAILARKEKALQQKARQQENALKTREQSLLDRENALNAREKQYSTDYIPKSRLQSDALGVLEEAGVTYDQVTQAQIDRTSVPPALLAHIKQLEARIATQEKTLEQAKAQGQEQQGEAYKAAITQITRDVRALVQEDPTFETIKATGSIKDVVELIEATYKEDGYVMSVEDAAKEVEDHLVSEIDKLTRIEKIRKRIPGLQTEKSVPQPQTNSQQPQTMKTLTNATSSTRKLTAKERAMLAFEGKLK